MSEEKPIEIASPPQPLLKLDLGCGDNCRDGFSGVDLWPGPNVKYCVNLWFPDQWLIWQDSSVDEIHCSHVVEHIPTVWWGKNEQGKYVHKIVPDKADDKDLFFVFFEQIHRILKPEARATIIVPSATSDRGFQDSTHRRFIVQNTWLYLSEDWRKANKLEHYGPKCAFAQECSALYNGPVVAGRTPEVRDRMGFLYRNVISDWVVVLTAKKDAPQ